VDNELQSGRRDARHTYNTVLLSVHYSLLNQDPDATTKPDTDLSKRERKQFQTGPNVKVPYKL